MFWAAMVGDCGRKKGPDTLCARVGGEAQSVAAAMRDCRDQATALGELYEAADRQVGEFAAAAEKHADEIRALKRVIVNDRALNF